METQLTEKEKKIIDILRTQSGAEVPISGAALAMRVGVKSVQVFITSLRLKRFPICSKGRGYFYAHEDGHLDDFIRKVERKSQGLIRELEGLRASYFNINSFERAMGKGGQVEYFETRAVRTPSGSVAYQKFKIGPDGKADIPAGTQLV